MLLLMAVTATTRSDDTAPRQNNLESAKQLRSQTRQITRAGVRIVRKVCQICTSTDRISIVLFVIALNIYIACASSNCLITECVCVVNDVCLGESFCTVRGKAIMSSYRPPSTLKEVRDYVLQDTAAQVQSADTVRLRISHSNLRAVFPELRLSRSMSIADVKDKLYLHVGTRQAYMKVFLRKSPTDLPGLALLDNNRSIGSYNPSPAGDTLHVVDEDPFSSSKGGWLEDTSLVEKYRISDEDYARRPDNYLKYKERMREHDPNWTMSRALSTAQGQGKRDLGGESDTKNTDEATNCPAARIGDRVEVTPGGKRGVVRFVGRDLPDLPPGWWLGVCYDEPVGKNDGAVKGIRYFEAPRNHGALVRPSNATVGDFPPLDDFSDSDEI